MLLPDATPQVAARLRIGLAHRFGGDGFEVIALRQARLAVGKGRRAQTVAGLEILLASAEANAVWEDVDRLVDAVDIRLPGAVGEVVAWRRASLALRRDADAGSLLTPLARHSPNAARFAHVRGVDAAITQDFTSAEAHFLEVARLAGTRRGRLIGLIDYARTKYAAGQFEDAAEAYGVAAQSGAPSVALEQAWTEFWLGNHAAALTYLESPSSGPVTSTWAEARYLAGLSLAESCRVDLALTQLASFESSASSWLAEARSVLSVALDEGPPSPESKRRLWFQLVDGSSFGVAMPQDAALELYRHRSDLLRGERIRAASYDETVRTWLEREIDVEERRIATLAGGRALYLIHREVELVRRHLESARIVSAEVQYQPNAPVRARLGYDCD